MRCRLRKTVVTLSCVCGLTIPSVSAAQSPEPAGAPALQAPRADSFWAPFIRVPGDFKRFASDETLTILTSAGVIALAAHGLDDDGIELAMTRLQPANSFTAGNIGGGFLAQTGGAFAVYTLGRVVKSQRVSAVGSDLVRAQILTQGTVQLTKRLARRARPDDSDRFSLPSGHAAGTFATATVLHRHFGWKIGVPAYAAGAYVATARMSANKHHLSDVILGAAFGIAAGRTVSVGTTKHRFDVGVSPTVGGGAITFIKK